MANRYSGTVTIRIRYVDSTRFAHNGHYHVSMTSPCNMARCGVTMDIMAPNYLSHAVDSAEAYDGVAKAALAFAADMADKCTDGKSQWGDAERYAHDLIECAHWDWDPSTFGGEGWAVFRSTIAALDARDSSARKAG
jgi:hypothetical protein